MDTFQSNPAAQTSSSELQEQCYALRHLVVSLLVLMIVVSGTLNIFFLRQWRDAHREVLAVRPQAQQMMATYQKSEAPMMQSIVNKFTEYGRTHVDYMPILNKYGIKPSTSVAAPPADGSKK